MGASNDPTPEELAEKVDLDDKPTRASDGELDKPWVETDHPRVYYANEGDRMYDIDVIGEELAEAFPNWDVVITQGPYRGYDIAYDIRYDLGALHIDCYSVRPGYHELGRVTRDIHEALERFTEEIEDNEGDA